MGVGKTTLVKNCIAGALGLPIAMIPLGGVTDSSVLTGHKYTYEGSTYGAVSSALMNAKCMNPVLLMDELDKVGGESRQGQEVYNVLIHLTDPVQNDAFVDDYFADAPLNLSQALIVFTFNHMDRINPILRDRMTIIRTEGYNVEDKKKIAVDHLLPKICEQHGVAGMSIIPEAVAEIVARVPDETGVRNLERALELIVGNINLQRMLSATEASDVVIDAALVREHVPDNRSQVDPSLRHIYL